MTAGDGHDGATPPAGTPSQEPRESTAPEAAGLPTASGAPEVTGVPEPADMPESAGSPDPAGMPEAAGAHPSTPVLALHGATKSFGAVRAVTDGTIDLYAGEAHALVGENGAGKSTMVKILAGVYQPDSGELLIDGDAGQPAQPGRGPARRDRGHLPGAHPVPRPERRGEHLHGPPAAAGRAADRPAPDARGLRRPVRPARGQARPGPHQPRAVHRGPADRRDRQGPVAGRPGHRHGRAHRGPVRCRGRPAVRRGRHAALRRRGGPVHLPPAGGGLRDLPAGDGHA